MRKTAIHLLVVSAWHKAARSSLCTRLARASCSVARARCGSVAVTVAVSATTLLGAAALATEAGSWYLVRRNLQSAADAAAIAGARSIAGGKTDDVAKQVATDVVARNGFTTADTRRATRVDIQIPPNTSPHQITVNLAQTQPLLLSRVLRASAAVVPASATAIAQSDPGGACVLALGQPIAFAGNSNLLAPSCGLGSNYSNADSMRFGSGGSDAGSSFKVTTSSLVSTGGCTTCSAAQALLKLTFTVNSPAFYRDAVTNPYASLDSHAPMAIDDMTRGSACGSAKKLDLSLDHALVELAPGCYTGISVTGGRTLRLSPGIYVISQGNFSVSGGTTVDCPQCAATNSGVTIVLVPGTGGKQTDNGVVDIQANSIVDLTAYSSTTDPKLASGLDGVLFYRDGRWPVESGTTRIQIQGGPAIKLKGAIVGPTTLVQMNGGPNTDTAATTSCMAFVVRGITFQGGSGLSTAGCSAIGVRLPSLQIVKLTG
jgi:Flp pilus assembly protein TadG